MSEFLDRLRAKQEERSPLETRQQATQKAADPSLDINSRLRAAQRAREQGVHVPDPTAMDQASRRRLLAQQVGETNLREGGLDDFGMRFDLGLSDTFEEKKAKFLEKYPEGEFEVVFDQPRESRDQRATTIIFRRHPEEQYAELDPSMLEKSELFADFADFSGEIPATVLEAIYTRGAKLWTQLWKSAASTAAGDTFKEAVEEVRGFQKETLPEFLQREAGRVVAGAGGAAASVAVSGPLNFSKGAPLIAVKPGTAAAQRAAKRLDVPSFLPGQVARSPLLQKLQGQASAVLKTVNDYVSNQMGAVARAVGRLREGDLKKVLAGQLEEVHDAARNQIIRSGILTPNRSLTEAGTAIQRGIAEYDDLSNLLVNRAYQRARLIEEPQFDLTKLQSIAKSIRDGVSGVGPDGKPVKLSETSPELNKVINKIMLLDPSLPAATRPDGTVVPGIEQLRALRSQLWDMKTPPPGEIARQSHKEAGKVYAALTNTMRNPVNSNPQFVEKWRAADALASRRFDTMEQLMVIEAGKTQEPAKLAASLAKPNQVDNLRVLRDVMPDSKWREFQDGVRAHFMSPENIDTLSKRLDTFDQSTLDALLSRSDQAALREIGTQIDNLNSIGIKEVLKKQETAAGIVRELTVNNDRQGIRNLLELAERRPDLRDSIRAGLVEDIWNRAVQTVDGVRQVDKSAIGRSLKELRESGAIHFLDSSDIRTLKDAEVVAEILETQTDTGASLQAGEAVAGARSLSGSALQTIIEHISLGRVLTSKTMQRILLGKGGPRKDFNSLRVIGSVLGREYEKMSRGKEER